ncbi:MAG: hypothetical protein JNN15_18850 [Blastocatellia bacterium]|nr:hypothetical protein [Blastocatellia bacterium]
MQKVLYFLSTLLIVIVFSGTSTAQSGRVRSNSPASSGSINEPSRNSSTASRPVKETTVATGNFVPKGSMMELRLDSSLSSKTSKKGDEFIAPLSEPLLIDGRMIIPKSAYVKCHVINAQPAKRNRTNGTITIGFDELVLETGETFKFTGTLVSIADRRDDVVEEEGEGKIQNKRKSGNVPVTVGTTAGVGAVIGAVSGGGAIAGGAIGAGVGLGSILLSKGQDIELFAGMRLQVRIDNDLNLDKKN